jgi:hypothetical protein
LPVPGPPVTIVTPEVGDRIASSCSRWMVATMSRIPVPVALDRLASSAPSPMMRMSSGAASGSSRSSSMPVTRSRLDWIIRRRTTPIGSAGVAR